MDFTALDTAMQNLLNAKSNLEAKSGSNDTAQKALTDATTAATGAANDLAAAVQSIKDANTAVQAALVAVEGQLAPPAPAPAA